MTERLEPLPYWFVVFVDSSADVWFHKPLKKGFRHCFAFAWDAAAARWIFMDALWDMVHLRAVDDATIGRLIAGYRAKGARMVIAKVERQRLCRPRLMLSCVSAIEAMLGLGSSCAVTPYRLYRTLLARGAIEIT